MLRPWPRRRPRTTVVTDPAADDPALAEARDAVLRTGDWRPAAALLAAVDPERRSDRVTVLGEATVADPAWADRWRTERPDDPDATLVRASGEIARAWDARGGDYASGVTEEQFETFRRRLAHANTLCERAVDLAPRDPAARVPLLWLAIGQDRSASDFRRRWDGLVALNPRHRAGHEAALQYWCAKWHGSHEQMYAFARAAATPDSWTVLLPLMAHVEWDLGEQGEGVARAVAVTRAWEHSPEIRADIDAALHWASGTETSLEDLTVLGYALYQSNRMAEADEVFARTDYRVHEYPWYYHPAGAEKGFRKAVSAVGWWLWSEQPAMNVGRRR